MGAADGLTHRTNAVERATLNEQRERGNEECDEDEVGAHRRINGQRLGGGNGDRLAHGQVMHLKKIESLA